MSERDFERKEWNGFCFDIAEDMIIMHYKDDDDKPCFSIEKSIDPKTKQTVFSFKGYSQVVRYWNIRVTEPEEQPINFEIQFNEELEMNSLFVYQASPALYYNSYFFGFTKKQTDVVSRGDLLYLERVERRAQDGKIVKRFLTDSRSYSDTYTQVNSATADFNTIQELRLKAEFSASLKDIITKPFQMFRSAMQARRAQSFLKKLPFDYKDFETTVEIFDAIISTPAVDAFSYVKHNHGLHGNPTILMNATILKGLEDKLDLPFELKIFDSIANLQAKNKNLYKFEETVKTLGTEKGKKTLLDENGQAAHVSALQYSTLSLEA